MQPDSNSPSSKTSSCGCGPKGCGPQPGVSRRNFLIGTGVGVAAVGGSMPLMAGPFEDTNEYLKLIPSDKKLDPAWVRSLFERGKKETYTDPKALGHIGMPVGGLFAGTVYLSGDGRLWLWDVFNRDPQGILSRPITYKGGNVSTTSGGNYVDPAPVTQPFAIGFALRIGEKIRNLDLTGFADVEFDGRYPMGRVRYADAGCPAVVQLEAFSPFIPLNVDDSSLPATILSYTIENTGAEPIQGQLAGWMENAVCLDSRHTSSGQLRNRIVRGEKTTTLVCEARQIQGEKSTRPDVPFEDFEKTTYEGWTVEGEAFGSGPVLIKDIPDYQGDVAGKGKRVANSHASAPGSDVGAKDAATGKLTSPEFTIERNFIQFLLGGGNHAGQTCVNLLIDGQPVASLVGPANNRMQPASFDVRKHQGKKGRLEIVDAYTGAWGNIGVDEIVFTDQLSGTDLTEKPDFGTMALALLDARADDCGNASIHSAGVFEQPVEEAICPLGEKLIGSVGRAFQLAPGEKTTITFVVAWHFPNFYSRGVGARVGHYYASRFASASAVADYIAGQFDRLAGTTRRWVETWYDSTLPYWLLDRTIANVSTLATTTCYRFEDGRFWAWEGIGCCPGTCTHVWHYAQGPGRVFPEVERLQREQVDFGLGQHADGGVGMRAGLTGANEAAHDGQCGRILGALREHQMSADDAFLKRIWPNVKRAVQFLIQQDANGDGMIEGAQPNTLDAAWFGKVSFLASLYLAALRAGEAMATEMGDPEFARQCKTIADRGAQTILETYNGEFFIQIEDPARKNEIGVGPGCYIDQVFGQTWAHWVGLGRLFDREKQLSALRSLWTYNFVPDVGPFRDQFQRGRWYATAGDAGLLMCTWPKGGKRDDWEKHWQYMYFNECMSGFEWQVASHMVWEGNDQPDLLQDGLAVGRAIHDRYNAALRNPYNEIECSDHYARAMASYGVFQAACGFYCHGPQGRIGFDPRLTPDDFQAAFIGPTGWGTYRQKRTAGSMTAALELKEGNLQLKSIALVPSEGMQVASAVVKIGDREVPASVSRVERQAIVELKEEVQLEPDQTLEVALG